MAVPKKRKSKSSTRQRRAQHDKMRAPNLTFCDNCGEPKIPHRICGSCGYYRGRRYLVSTGL